MLPVLFQSGPFVIYTHDAFTLLGLLVGLGLYYRELARRKMFCSEIFWISIAAVIGAGIGCRLITVWEHPAYYASFSEVPLTYFISHSGKGIIGGLLGGYIGVVLSKRAFGYTVSTGDCYSAAIALATAIGRVGCYLAELPLGKPTDLPWGITIDPAAALNFATCPYCDQKMHPSMVYEILFNLVAFVVILRYRDRVIVQGDSLKIYLLVASVFRFFIEFTRANSEQLWGLTGAQVDLIPITALLVYYFVRQWRRGVYRLPPAPPAYAAAE